MAHQNFEMVADRRRGAYGSRHDCRRRPLTAPAISDADARRGFFFALSAYLLWGVLPFYMKAVAHIPAAEVVAHRIVWSVPIAGVLLLLMGRTADIKIALRTPRTLAMGALTAALITINWGIYVWAIATDRALETALGYYINPLFSVFLGAVLLGEKLSRAQIGGDRARRRRPWRC